MVKQERVSIRGLKVCEFASEETLCYECKVLIDGKAIGRASNQGHGGSTFVEPASGGWSGPFAEPLRAAERWAKTLPPILCEDSELKNDDGSPFTIAISLDWIVDELAQAEHNAKKMQRACTRAMKRRILFLKLDGKGVFQTKPILDLPRRLPDFARGIMERHPGCTILNTLPTAEAVRLFTAAQEAAEEAA